MTIRKPQDTSSNHDAITCLAFSLWERAGPLCRSWLLSFCLLAGVLFLPRQTRAAAISFLQAATGSSDGQVSSLAASALTTTAGDLLIAAVTWDTGAGSTVSISDSKGNVWASATTRQVDTRNNQALQVFYAPNIAGGSDSVKVVPSPAASWVRLVVHEVAGVAPSAPLDKTAVNNTGSGTSISIGPVTTSAAGEYIFTAAMNDGATGSANLSAGSGYKLRAAVASGDSELASADQVQSGAGSISAAWTLSGSSQSLAQMATFKAASAASGSAPAITSFSATPSTMSAGQSAQLSWVVSGSPAPTLSINNGVGTVTGSSVSVSPAAATTTYTLTAVNASGSASAQTTVTVQPASGAPAITSFSASPSTIAVGQSAQLSWVVTGSPAPTFSIDNGVGTVSGSSVAVSPAATTTYTLTAQNASGSASAETTVTVGTGGSSGASPYPLKASANGRYVINQAGNPFLIIGDAPHSLAANLDTADAAYYLNNRSVNGFNTLWVESLVNPYCNGRANGSLIDDVTVPFTGTVASGVNSQGTPYYDLTTPNPSYWAQVDLIVSMAATNGLEVLLDSLDTGGWLDIAVANGTTRCQEYGQFLGARYASYPNILWITGNDFQDWSDVSDDAVITAIAKGIQQEDPDHLQTTELDYYVSYSLEDHNWLLLATVDSVYSYYPTYAECLAAYNAAAVPAMLEEANYEYETNGGAAEGGSRSVLRRQEYWSMTGGALAGHVYGNHYTWTFASGWKNYLDSPGLTDLQYFHAFFGGLAWYNLVPDQAHTFVTSGYGTYSSSGNIIASDYSAACVTADGTLGVVYTPVLTNDLVVALSKMAGAVTARWYDPSAGTYTAISGSPFANSGTHTFIPPGKNSAGDTDWVLLLQAN